MKKLYSVLLLVMVVGCLTTLVIMKYMRRASGADRHTEKQAVTA